MKRLIRSLSVPLLVVPVTLITFWLISGSSDHSYLWFLVFLLNLVFLPTLAVFWLVWRKMISDLDLEQKAERLTFLALIAASALVNYLDSYILAAPKNIRSLNLLGFVLVTVLVLVTLFWKISVHLLVLTSFIFVALVFKGAVAWPLLLILPVVAAHRIYFKHHNLAQVFLGFFLGAVLTLAVLKLSGF